MMPAVTRASSDPGRTVRAAVVTGLMTATLVMAGLIMAPRSAGAAFERSIEPSSRDAVCDAGPAQHLVALLMSPTENRRWSLRVTSLELYGLSELRGSAAALVRCSRGSRAALAVASLGGALYREQTLELSVSRRWSQEIALELRSRALSMSWEGGGAEWSGAVDVSAAWLVRGRLVIGLSVRNATRASVLTSQVASRISTDAALVLDGVTLFGSLAGEPGFEPSPAVGCELALAPWIRLRGGVRTGPPATALGLRLGSGRALRPDIDLTWMWHPVLGSSHSLTVSTGI